MLGSVSNCVRRHLSMKLMSKVSCLVLSSSKVKHVLPGTTWCASSFHNHPINFIKKNADAETEKQVVIRQQEFKTLNEKNKSSFLSVVNAYSLSVKGTRGHVEFIYAALRCMEECNVQFDLEAYKKLMDVFPKGKYMPKNMIQAEFFHFPRHQDCGIALLDQMDYNGVLPDKEMKELVLNIFGKSSMVFKKLCRMMYWMPKFKNLNPYDTMESLPSDIELLAELAMKKMSVDQRTKISHFKTADLEGAVDDTWVVSAQSPAQQELLQKHKIDKPVYVEGPFLIWMRRVSLSYFILRAEPEPIPTVDEIDEDDVSNISLYMFGEPKPKHLTVARTNIHEQEDGTILGMCATGTSSKDSVLSWVRFLQQSNPSLENIPVLFTLKSMTAAVTTLNIGDRSSASGDKSDGVNSEQQPGPDDLHGEQVSSGDAEEISEDRQHQRS